MTDPQQYMLCRGGWRYRVTCYYSDDVKPPKTPGGVAIETIHKALSSAQLDAAVGQARADIGEVLVEEL